MRRSDPLQRTDPIASRTANATFTCRNPSNTGIPSPNLVGHPQAARVSIIESVQLFLFVCVCCHRLYTCVVYGVARRHGGKCSTQIARSRSERYKELLTYKNRYTPLKTDIRNTKIVERYMHTVKKSSFQYIPKLILQSPEDDMPYPESDMQWRKEKASDSVSYVKTQNR